MKTGFKRPTLRSVASCSQIDLGNLLPFSAHWARLASFVAHHPLPGGSSILCLKPKHTGL